MTGTARIRWENTPVGTIGGHVGSIEQEAFAIWKPPQASGEWVLESDWPGLGAARCYGDDPDALKLEAERWLAGFVSSLGAAFAAEATLPQRDSHGMLDLTCDACGATTGTNCHDDDIRCAECGAHRCPHCGGWFGED